MLSRNRKALFFVLVGLWFGGGGYVISGVQDAEAVDHRCACEVNMVSRKCTFNGLRIL